MKEYFPIFENNPGLVYMDSTATSQKPRQVIDGVSEYLSHDYSNIHRGAYSLAERSEKMYVDSKKKVAEYIGAENWKEIIYSFNSTYASNLLVTSLRRSGYFQKGDKVLVSIVEHHANVVPWLILAEEVGVEVEYIRVHEDFSLDFEDLASKLDDRVKAVSLTHVSNVTGEIFDLERVNHLLSERYPPLTPPYQGGEENIPPLTRGRQGGGRPLFIVDASQSVPHMAVDVQKIGCDFLFFTGHKVMADSGIGVLWGKEALLSEMKPAFSGGGAISWVKKTCFKEAPLPDRFEPGTPNLSGAMSLLKAYEFIESIGGYPQIEAIEKELSEYFLQKFGEVSGVRLIGSTKSDSRVSVFSFIVDGVHSLDVADYLADHDICIRAGQHCAEPFMGELGVHHTCRASLYIYNTREDIDRFFEVLEQAILELK